MDPNDCGWICSLNFNDMAQGQWGSRGSLMAASVMDEHLPLKVETKLQCHCRPGGNILQSCSSQPSSWQLRGHQLQHHLLHAQVHSEILL